MNSIRWALEWSARSCRLGRRFRRRRRSGCSRFLGRRCLRRRRSGRGRFCCRRKRCRCGRLSRFFGC